MYNTLQSLTTAMSTAPCTSNVFNVIDVLASITCSSARVKSNEASLGTVTRARVNRRFLCDSVSAFGRKR